MSPYGARRDVANIQQTFKTPIYYQITNISISPSGYFIAISTEHSVHVATLPDSSRLHDTDRSEIKLKTHQVGPTTHVIPEAPLAGVLWHPFAVASPSSDSLVTVTTDAAVRLWELERTNHWSFERPALAIDLRKLANGTSSDQDFEPSGFGKSRGFSADAFDMEVAAVCFGGVGAENEDPWASMTLWTSMTNGDVYALCPLLPSKWMPSAMTVPALTTSAIAKMAGLPSGILPDDQRAANQRYEWVQELDSEQIQLGDDSNEAVRLRPSNPSAIPRLQGPFQRPIELDEDVEACGIFVMPANLDEEDLFSGEDDYELIRGSTTLPFTVICLTTTDNKVHIMIELDGVTGQWLPKKGRSSFSVPTWDAGQLVLLETISLPGASPDLDAQPYFTADTSSSYRFFVTNCTSVASFSLEDWASRVGGEVSSGEETDNGLQSRLALACQGSICVMQVLISQKSASFSTALYLEDINTGTLLLTSSNSRAVAVQIDQPSLRTSRRLTSESNFSASLQAHAPHQSTFRASQSLMQTLAPDTRPQIETPPTREPYAPPRVFYENHMAPAEQLRSRIPLQHRHVLTQSPMLMSPVCLGIMTSAHRMFSNQTSRIEQAVAELFRRCERLRQDLRDQVEQMVKLAERLQSIKAGDEQEDSHKTPDDAVSHDKQISNRIAHAQQRQKDLYARYERVRRRAAQVKSGNQPISISERMWINETEALSKHVGAEDRDMSADQESLLDRFEAAKQLSQHLIRETKQFKETNDKEPGKAGDVPQTPDGKLRTSLGAGASGVSRIQRERIKEVMDMVEREGVVIEAVSRRLANLGVST